MTFVRWIHWAWLGGLAALGVYRFLRDLRQHAVELSDAAAPVLRVAARRKKATRRSTAKTPTRKTAQKAPRRAR